MIVGSDTVECDVLIIGSGAAGLSAALTASVLGLEVLVCEQADTIGGASAVSGGEVWIPMNRQSGIDSGDSESAALAYLEQTLGPWIDRPRAETFVRHAAEALAFLEEHSLVEYELLPYVVDYFSNHPGATRGLRTLGAVPFDGRNLGPNFQTLRPPLAIGTIFGGMSIGRDDLPHLLNFTRSLKSAVHVASMLLRHASDRLRGYPRGTRLVMGGALMGRLLATLLDRRVEIWRDACVTELTLTQGRVSAAVVRIKGTQRRIVCRRATIIANGSFSGSASMRAKYFPHVKAGQIHHSNVPSSSDGSGLSLGERCGGVVDEHVAQPGAWAPVSLLTAADGSTQAFSHFGDRAKPGVIVVNRAGRRFANEAINYHDFVQAMLADSTGLPETEAFIVTSHRYLRKYGLGRVPAFPGRTAPFIRSGYLLRGRTIRELAEHIGAAPQTLIETIEEFNTHARRGVDPAFHKGETLYERAAGDPQQTPNPCLAPLDEGPFYAIRMIPGDIATLSGLRVDERSRVLSRDGTAIAGLYAIGTVARSVMGGVYPGAGAMLGPSITFGYLAARDIAGLAFPEAPVVAMAQNTSG
jgi:succinate dehydrogenase/fumarate reductase flavoprotein subunit